MVENCQDRQATPRYTLRLARTREEVEAATPCVCTSKSSIWNSKRDLRNLFTGIDEDEFDGVCEHLIVREAAGGCPRTKDHQNRCVAPCLSAGFSARSLSEEATSRCNVSSRPEINDCRPDQQISAIESHLSGALAFQSARAWLARSGRRASSQSRQTAHVFVSCSFTKSQFIKFHQAAI